MSGDFVHLHLHSEYSLLDGACRVKDIPARVKECGHTAVAITDHGVMYGAVSFYSACKEAGIKPIIGCEVYVAPKNRFEKGGTGESNYHHLVLLCENEIGYQNLIRLVSLGFTEGFYSRPRVDLELLRAHHEGLIALSGCLAGRIPSLLLLGDEEGAEKAARELSAIFGEGNFYIELQQHGLSEEEAVIPLLVSLASRLSLPLVATNDCHYLRRKDADVQATLFAIQTATLVSDGRPAAFATDEFYYKDTAEMRMLFGKYEGAIENTVKIAERCLFDFDFSHIYLPAFVPPGGMTGSAYLRFLALSGLKKMEADGTLPSMGYTLADYKARMDYELSVISEMGYSDYFLIVWDYVGFAKRAGIPVGPGRGSGAGSLVAYLIGITGIDPLRFHLLFERFLNPERVSMPDFDIDFCYNRREEVIRYVGEKYGSEYVSQIITFGTLAARAAVRDVGRALGMPYSEVDAVARAIPQELGITISDALKMPDLKKQYEGSAAVQKLVDTALMLEGMPRNISVHAAGIVITDRKVSDYVPLATSGDSVVTQYDMDTVSKLGLLKFDFLGLRYLTVLHDAETMIRELDPAFVLSQIPFDDKRTFELISKGNTLGVFQLESGGMRQMLETLSPSCLEDIIAAVALYRPGPMDSIPKYLEWHRHPEKIEYATPLLEPILKETYGCVVYQEQVMQIFREVAGYTFGHADVVRRAMAKKKASVMEAERENFLLGAAERGMEREKAERLFNDMISFSHYAFNKSHAAAYGLLSYETAYLKAHYPAQYLASLLTSVLGSTGKVSEYIAEAKRLGIPVLPPDINESKEGFTVTNGHIRFGLLALKNVGRQFLDSIFRERMHSPFASFADFIDRMSGGDLNKRMVESMIKAGAFDRLGVYRSRLLASYEQMVETALEKSRAGVAGQLDMFSLPVQSEGNRIETPVFHYPTLPDFSTREKLMQEKESTGMYFSGHLLDGYEKHLAVLLPMPIDRLLKEESDLEEKSSVRVAGVITSVTLKTTKKEEKMAFFTVEDYYGEIECLAFPRQLAKFESLIRPDRAVCLEGNLSLREDEPPHILVSSVAELFEDEKFEKNDRLASRYERGSREPAERNPPPARQATASTLSPQGTAERKPYQKVYLRFPDFECRAYLKAINLLGIFDEGTFPVILYSEKEKSYRPHLAPVVMSDYLRKELETLLGEENVVFR